MYLCTSVYTIVFVSVVDVKIRKFSVHTFYTVYKKLLLAVRVLYINGLKF